MLENITENHIEEMINLYNSYRNKEISGSDIQKTVRSFILINADEFNGILNERFIIDDKNILKELEKNISKKLKRMKKIETEKSHLTIGDIKMNIETGFKSALYMHFRFLYNNINTFNIDDHFAGAIFYFIREYCYSSMFRYNKSGKFNVPYGGSSYNKKYLKSKIDYIESEKLNKLLSNTNIFALDFEDFFKQKDLCESDFIFLDPPYDSSFSTYANNIFGTEDHKRLADFCYKTKAKFMLIIKNTDFIYELYKGFNIDTFDKKYVVSFQNRNDKDAEHLLITNYIVER